MSDSFRRSVGPPTLVPAARRARISEARSPPGAPLSSGRMSDAPWAGRRLHFIGIGGAGMSGLALVARRLGAQVSGSDRAESPYSQRLREAGITPEIGHDAGHLAPGADVV